ncbi:MAG TPA: SDR family oxidoreductase, partial [Rhizomicrobium sp.]|nr:SDR family oxidoreductase [Rhizomicrobium sp.]
MADAKSGLMAGKRGLVMGVANDHSIAWGIAQMLASHGAEIAFTYQGDAQKKRLSPLAQSVGSSIVLPGDVESDEQLDAAFATLKKEWGTLDFLVHAIAFSDREELKGRYVDTSRANFAKSLDISCYSFTAVAQRAAMGHQPGRALRHRREGIAGNIEASGEVGAGGIDIAALQLVAVGEGDGMHQEIDAVPFLFQRVERRIDRFGLGHVAIDQ